MSKQIDFIVSNFGSVWNILAVSKAAKEFAAERFVVEAWQGAPDNFTTDHRPARDICERLVVDGFIVSGGN